MMIHEDLWRSGFPETFILSERQGKRAGYPCPSGQPPGSWMQGTALSPSIDPVVHLFWRGRHE